MIPRAYITEWRTLAPWKTNEQVEQDLILSRILVEIFSDAFLCEHLAFRGGTALHKLYLAPAIRYSEDIDLIQKTATPIGPIFDRIKERLEFLGMPSRKRTQRDSALIYRFDSEIPPVSTNKIKIEINCREHFSVYGFQPYPFRVKSQWFQGKVDLPTFTLEELLGSKMRALYQRRKGRDLLDLWAAITQKSVNLDKVVHAFQQFMQFDDLSVSRADYEKNLMDKMQNKYFIGDTENLLREGIQYDPHTAFGVVMETLTSRLD